MHKVNRHAVAVPTCLHVPPECYNDLNAADKNSIRDALLEIQGQRCAYCERRTGDSRTDGHIEHFRSQALYQHFQCAWSNMFWSCNDEKTCGKYKDKCTAGSGPQRSFNHDDIVDPANEEPGNYLLFVSDGTVRPVEGLSATDSRRANETLRVFQLRDSALLRKSREDAVKPYIRAIETIYNLDPKHVQQYVQSELNNLTTTPFSTPIKTFLKSVT